MKTIAYAHSSIQTTSFMRLKPLIVYNTVYNTCCLDHWNEENERKNITSNLIVDHFSLTFVNLLLA